MGIVAKRNNAHCFSLVIIFKTCLNKDKFRFQIQRKGEGKDALLHRYGYCCWLFVFVFIHKPNK